MAVSINGLNKADVLAALYNASKPQGLGFMHYDGAPMTRAEAEAFLMQTTYFDYLKGRVMKIELASDDSFEEWLYDRDNGSGAAQRAIDELRATGDANGPETQMAHAGRTCASAMQVKSQLDKDTTFRKTPDMGVVTLGLSDVADVLAPKVDAAIGSLNAGKD